MKSQISTIGFVGMILACLFIFPSIASAVPSLVVAPGEPTPPGEEPPDSFEDVYTGVYEDYLATFAETFESGSDGFLLRPSGGSVSVVYGADNGDPALDQDIFIATDALGAADGDFFSFGGMEFGLIDGSDQADGYKPLPYYGVRLGSINEPNGDIEGTWVRFGVGDPAWPGMWYIWTAEFVYDDLVWGDWLFAFRDEDRSGDFTNSEEFSRKTTSSTVPDASVVFLLGSALIGLFALGRREVRG